MIMVDKFKFSMCFLLASFLLVGFTSCVPVQPLDLQGTQFFVATNGDNANNGSIELPWQTIEYSLQQLAPGDTLNIRGGIYYENEIDVSLQGEAELSIVIQPFEQEEVIIDGGVADFRTGGRAQWELVDSEIQLYKSSKTYNEDLVRGWLVDDDVQLIEYETYENLISKNYGPVNKFDSLYIGPGLHIDQSGTIFIRLQPNPNDLVDYFGNAILPKPINQDPNQNDISIFFSKHVFGLDQTSYLNFKDISIHNSVRAFDFESGTHHIGLSNLDMRFGSYGIIFRENVSDIEIKGSNFNNGLPDYVYWTDVKNRSNETAEAYPEFQSDAIQGTFVNVSLENNIFHHSFDGLDLKDGSINSSIVGNTFVHIRDDAINISRASSNIEIAHNVLRIVGSGISNLGSDGAPGHVYIHHNVIDNSIHQRGGRIGNFREDNWPVWTVIDPFSIHDDGNKTSWWKLYNNTIVSRIGGYEWSAAGPTHVTGNDEFYVYNNIFYVFDGRVIFRDALESEGANFDGNVIYQAQPGDFPLLLNFGDGESYFNLEDFRTNSGTKWEVHGLNIDPLFNVCNLINVNVDLNDLQQLYRPGNDQVFTTGVIYTDLGWPGTEDVTYRGAIAIKRRGREISSSCSRANFLPITVN